MEPHCGRTGVDRRHPLEHGMPIVPGVPIDQLLSADTSGSALLPAGWGRPGDGDVCAAAALQRSVAVGTIRRVVGVYRMVLLDRFTQCICQPVDTGRSPMKALGCEN